MSNYNNDNTARRYKAHLTSFGTTQLHLRKPNVVAWWSAAFPGFGHLLLGKYIVGFALFVWEVFINVHSNLNLAMVHTFQGEFEMAKEVLNPKLLLVYIPVYLFGIWDSYRSTVDLNKIYVLAERENHNFNSYKISALNLNYLDKRNPVLSVLWSLLTPGLGHLYIQRLLTAFFIIVWVIIFAYFSDSLEAILLIFLGQIEEATYLLKAEWLLFFPSIYGFAIYDSYINTVEHNKLFEKEQRKYLIHNYQNSSFKIF